MADKLEQLRKYRDNPNVQAALTVISKAEGTFGQGDNGYNVSFGGATFDDYSTHPNMQKGFTETTGRKNTSGAAGKFQIIKPTYDALTKQLGTGGDFSPETQDLMAIELLRQRGALDKIMSGDIAGGLDRVNSVWASLPGSPHPQSTRTPSQIDAWIAEGGGAPPVEAELPAKPRMLPDFSGLKLMPTTPPSMPAMQMPMQPPSDVVPIVPVETFAGQQPRVLQHQDTLSQYTASTPKEQSMLDYASILPPMQQGTLLQLDQLATEHATSNRAVPMLPTPEIRKFLRDLVLRA